MNKIWFLILGLIFSSHLFAAEEIVREEKNTAPSYQHLSSLENELEEGIISTKSNKTQIQLNPPLWLHIKVDRNSSYSAYADAWVTLGSEDTARRYTVNSISLSLTFESTIEDIKLNSSEIKLSSRTNKPCSNSITAHAKTIGPNGSVSASTY